MGGTDAVPEENGELVAKLTLPDGTIIELPFLTDAAGGRFVDIRRLQPTTGIVTFDPGFTSTASCMSTITYIDGNKGVLLYRVHDGIENRYNIEQLAEHGDFYDSAFLLLHGELPTLEEKNAFASVLTRHTLVPEQLINFYRGFRHDAHPMAIMCGVVGAFSAFYPQSADIGLDQQRLIACERLIAKMPTLAAIAHKTHKGMPIVYPRNDLNYSERFLHMMFATPCEAYTVDPVMARALEVILILHMDHEQNASTSTVRTAGSSQANPFACVASGIAALWGPAHGGANEAVLRMLEQIGTPDRIPEAIARAKDKSDPFRLMGFGHRVYKTYDPRARIMRQVCYTVLDHLQVRDPLLDVAMELEKIALSDEYFVKRSLYPNVDFYSGVVLKALGIPINMFTVLFAVARTVGWVAQWKEMSEEPVPRICRPRQMFMGHMDREYLPLEKRGGEGEKDLSEKLRDDSAGNRGPLYRKVSSHVSAMKAG